MAGNFVKELLAEKSIGVKDQSTLSLSETLKELFASFFPDKKFMGPQPTPEGGLAFPVITPNGTEHDLDELSSGEKEILYGYLRIRSSAQRDSIILLDEPELHLNPRLIRGLPEFYRKHLGEALQNQLWLVTHSDALIREAVGKSGFNVFHMIPCGAQALGSSQLKPLAASDLDIVIADLVGDLASYRPGGKAIIFEGGGDSDFDKTIVASLFSKELRGINLLSGTNKTRVNALHEIMERAYKNGDHPTKFYALTDKDSDERDEASKAISRMSWDVYHIENYLLDSKIIAETVNSLSLNREITFTEVDDKLCAAARQVVPSMLIHQMRAYANSQIVRAISLGFPPETLTIGSALFSAASRSAEKISKLTIENLSEDSLKNLEQTMRANFEKCFADGSWRSSIPGREILKRFVDGAKLPVGYEVFRNLLVTRMVESSYQPPGMKSILMKIVDD